MPFGINPVQIDNTLSGLDANTLAQALAQQQAQELAARAQQATQAASQAGQQYGELASAPPPDIMAQQAFLPTLIGNIASVISQNPDYRKRTQDQLDEQRKTLLDARARNLTQLRDVYSQQAEAARQAGNLEAEQKARTQHDRISGALEQVLENQRQQNRLDLQKLQGQQSLQEIAARGSEERKTNAVKAQQVAVDNLPDYTIQTAVGRKFIDTSGLAAKDRSALVKAARAAGLPAPTDKESQALKDVDRARRDMMAFQDYVKSLLPRDAQGRALNAANMKISRVLQTNEQRAAFRTLTETAIPALRAMAGSGGLRISIPLVEQTIGNMPRDTDTFGTAMRKFRIIYTMLDNSESPILDRNWAKPGIESARSKAITAARTDDDATLRALIRRYPELDNDEILLDVIRSR